MNKRGSGITLSDTSFFDHNMQFVFEKKSVSHSSALLDSPKV